MVAVGTTRRPPPRSFRNLQASGRLKKSTGHGWPPPPHGPGTTSAIRTGLQPSSRATRTRDAGERNADRKRSSREFNVSTYKARRLPEAPGEVPPPTSISAPRPGSLLKAQEVAPAGPGLTLCMSWAFEVVLLTQLRSAQPQLGVGSKPKCLHNVLPGY